MTPILKALIVGIGSDFKILSEWQSAGHLVLKSIHLYLAQSKKLTEINLYKSNYLHRPQDDVTPPGYYPDDINYNQLGLEFDGRLTDFLSLRNTPKMRQLFPFAPCNYFPSKLNSKNKQLQLWSSQTESNKTEKTSTQNDPRSQILGNRSGLV